MVVDVGTRTRMVAPARRPPQQHAPRRGDHPLVFLVPAFAILAVFFVLPTVFNFVYAFTDWSSFKSGIVSVGLANFQTLLADGSLLDALRITLVYAVLVAVFQNLFGLGLALLLERDTVLNRFARAAFFVPVLMSALAVGYIFQALLRPDGALNDILGFLLAREVQIAWLGSTDLDDRGRRGHPRVEVDGPVDAHLPGRAQDDAAGRAGGRAHRRRLVVADVLARSGSRCWRRRSRSTSPRRCSAR